jgi:hypothetical protein
MSPFIVLPVAIIVLIVGFYYLGIWCGVWPPVSALFEREVDYFTDPEEAAGMYDELAVGITGQEVATMNTYGVSPIRKEAVEVNRPATPAPFGPETFEMADMALRITRPHLFADTWLGDCRKEFSHWAAEQWRLIDLHQQEMKIGVYAA